jgi:hypothetical protein
MMIQQTIGYLAFSDLRPLGQIMKEKSSVRLGIWGAFPFSRPRILVDLAMATWFQPRMPN